MLNPATQTWMVLDPTFGLAAKRANGDWATAEDIATATRMFGWTAGITYVFLDADTDAYAKAYYLDYPLLYVNVLHQGHLGQVSAAGSWQPYMEMVSPPVTGDRRLYIVQSTSSSVINVVIDGSATEVACSGPESLSSAFIASSVDVPADGQTSFVLYRPLRFVF